MKAWERPRRRPGHQEASSVITAALGTATFPATKEKLVGAVGDWKVPLGEGREAPLADILRALPEEEFASFQDATNRVDQHWAAVQERLRG